MPGAAQNSLAKPYGAPARFVFHGDLPSLPTRAARQSRILPGGPPGVHERRYRSHGVPHAEVRTLLVDGRATDFGALLGFGQVVDVHPPDVPAEPPVGVSTGTPLRPALAGARQGNFRLVADVNAGGWPGCCYSWGWT